MSFLNQYQMRYQIHLFYTHEPIVRSPHTEGDLQCFKNYINSSGRGEVYKVKVGGVERPCFER